MQLYYRSRQWWFSLSAELTASDDAFVRARLSHSQHVLFTAMLPRDQVHAVAVYRSILREHPEVVADPDLAPIAFLHDSGKVGTRLWHRVVFVLLQDLAPWILRRLGEVGPHDIRYPFYALREHPRLGASLVLAAGCNKRVSEAICRHHDRMKSKTSTDTLLRLLQDADAGQ